MAQRPETFDPMFICFMPTAVSLC